MAVIKGVLEKHLADQASIGEKARPARRLMAESHPNFTLYLKIVD